MTGTISHFINGAPSREATRSGDVYDPNTGQVQARVAFASAADLDRAVRGAAAAQPRWAAVNPQRPWDRVRANQCAQWRLPNGPRGLERVPFW
jgi:acyl-CoA reductase-like NAD-dependent aldehyde dehydrogenase